jgi:hypothetical protein
LPLPVEEVAAVLTRGRLEAMATLPPALEAREAARTMAMRAGAPLRLLLAMVVVVATPVAMLALLCREPPPRLAPLAWALVEAASLEEALAPASQVAALAEAEAALGPAWEEGRPSAPL